MTTNTCTICLKPKAPYQCGICSDHLCKKCARFLDEDHFSFLTNISEDLKKGIYCNPCFESKVAPAQESYDEIMERARNVYVFFADQGKETRLYSRIEPAVSVSDCEDHDEAILRMAFLAAQAGFNGLIDIKIASQKIQQGSYQHLIWHASGIPTQIDPKKLDRPEPR